MTRCIYAQGPEPRQDRRTGDEIPEWTVYVGDGDAEPRSKVYRLTSLDRARSLALRMSQDRRLELHDDTQPA
ncbi:MAG TPA: hypothetical protein PKA21_09030 [Kiritimatiellia bacterium]|mgnify:CR=1 FL=1|nr:hypothetical protein [Kiritimatiellia bacterium]